MHEEKVMDTDAPQRGAVQVARPRHYISGVARPCQLWRGRPNLDGEKGPFRLFLIRLKARSLGDLKKSLGNQKDNLETF